jgi:hypothetical protein
MKGTELWIEMAVKWSTKRTAESVNKLELKLK